MPSGARPPQDAEITITSVTAQAISHAKVLAQAPIPNLQSSSGSHREAACSLAGRLQLPEGQ